MKGVNREPIRPYHHLWRIEGGWQVNPITVDHIGPSMRTDQFHLPPAVTDLVGRDDAIEQIQRQLDRSGRPLAAVVASIAGRAGVGKTALAVRVAQELQPTFPDGQFYVDLGGPGEQPADPDDVLGDILHEFGMARKEIEDGLVSRTRQYRDQLAQRKVLLVLDNAAEKQQVEPLLPVHPGSAALITSRAQLGSLEAPSVVTHSMVLDVLDEEEAVTLLAQAMDDERVAREPEAARRIVELCGHLPLAVRMAGARLAGSRQASLAGFAARLADERGRLAESESRDLEVRASFALNYQQLQQDERRLFRLLGLVKAPDYPDWVAAALLDSPLGQAQDLIERLVRSEVLAVARKAPDTQTRYRFHDLLRALAHAHLEAEEDEADQDAALGRMLADSLELASRAAELMEPGVPRPVSARPPPERLSRVAERLSIDPAAWFDDERVGLLAAVDQADDSGRPEVVWELARALNYFFKIRAHWTDWQRTQQLALRAARDAGNEPATANALRSLGDLRTQLGQLATAVSHFEEALQLFRKLRLRDGQAWSLVGLGGALHEQGQYDRAVERLQDALLLFRQSEDGRRGEAWALEWLGVVRRYQGRLDEAFMRVVKGLELFREVGDRRGEAYCLMNLSAINRDRLEYEAAIEWLGQAPPLFDELRDRQGAAYVLLNKGHILRDQRRYQEAQEVLDTCLRAIRKLGDRTGEAWTRFNLGMIHQAQSRDDEAMVQFDECRRLFRLLRDDRGGALTSIGEGHVQLHRNRVQQAIASFRQALGALPAGDELGQARALSGLGLALAANGESIPAASSWRSALEIFRRLGSQEAAEVEGWLAERR
jgi:tetratricopeptide (TPR) repeat protein